MCTYLVVIAKIADNNTTIPKFKQASVSLIVMEAIFLASSSILQVLLCYESCSTNILTFEKTNVKDVRDSRLRRLKYDYSNIRFFTVITTELKCFGLYADKGIVVVALSSIC